MSSARQRVFLFLQIACFLGVVAWLAPIPTGPSDKDQYERVGREWFVLGCDIHCFRVLVPWALEALPGEGHPKWRTYAVICEAGAALLMALWVMRFGASERVARQVAWLTAVSVGALYTLFDPFTADPLMHLAGPLVMLLAVDGSFKTLLWTTVFGVFGKEFAVVPVAIATGQRLLQRRYADATRLAVIAGVGVTLWVGWQWLLRSYLGYSTNGSKSQDLLGGGYLRYWLSTLEPGVVVVSLGGALGALWMLWPVGVRLGTPPVRQLTWAALVPIAALSYVQQPDRALGNFAFVMMPAVAMVLERTAPLAGWLLVGLQALVGLRLGAQLDAVPRVRMTLMATLALAFVLAWQALRRAPEPRQGVASPA